MIRGVREGGEKDLGVVSMCRKRGSVLTLSPVEVLAMVSVCRELWSSRTVR